MLSQPINFTGTGDQTVVTANATDSTEVFDALIFVSGAGTLKVMDVTNGTTFGIYTLAGAGSIQLAPMGGAIPRFTGIGGIKFNMSTSLTVTGHITVAAGPK